MNDLFLQGIELIKGLVMLVTPEVILAPDLLANLNKYLDIFVDWLSAVNFLVPLPDIFTIIVLLMGEYLLQFGLFIVNWIIRRIADFFP